MHDNRMEFELNFTKYEQLKRNVYWDLTNYDLMGILACRTISDVTSVGESL